ncbi:MAG: nucleotidyl transferase AbiEii/AbiGii toxin family protein, partial [Gemmatimonadaceae bacterium]
DLDLAHAVPGTLALVPPKAMRDALRRDYNAMAGMIFGTVPSFDGILTAIGEVEAIANGAGPMTTD